MLGNIVDQVSWFPTLSDLYDELGLICARNSLIKEAMPRSTGYWKLERAHFYNNTIYSNSVIMHDSIIKNFIIKDSVFEDESKI